MFLALHDANGNCSRYIHTYSARTITHTLSSDLSLVPVVPPSLAAGCNGMVTLNNGSK